jgi:hypothetical protein
MTPSERLSHAKSNYERALRDVESTRRAMEIAECELEVELACQELRALAQNGCRRTCAEVTRLVRDAIKKHGPIAL